MNVPKELRYTKSHEWVRVENEVLVVGITDFAQSQLSDLTFVELPEADEHFDSSDEVAVVESVKAASDIYAPVAGTIIEINEKLIDSPEMINTDPYKDGWIFKMKPDNAADAETLLDADAYEEIAPDSD